MLRIYELMGITVASSIIHDDCQELTTERDCVFFSFSPPISTYLVFSGTMYIFLSRFAKAVFFLFSQTIIDFTSVLIRIKWIPSLRERYTWDSWQLLFVFRALNFLFGSSNRITENDWLYCANKWKVLLIQYVLFSPLCVHTIRTICIYLVFFSLGRKINWNETKFRKMKCVLNLNWSSANQ